MPRHSRYGLQAPWTVLAPTEGAARTVTRVSWRSMSGPRPGDWVRAVTDDRTAQAVEGQLGFVFVEILNYVQVNVIAKGKLIGVRPSSIEVVQPGHGAPPAPPCPADLEEAARRNLLPREWDQPGGAWADMEHRLELIIAPLLSAGWTVTDRATDVSWEYGDSIIFDLERGGHRIELESFGDGWLTYWEIDDDEDDEDADGEPSDPVWQVDASDLVAAEAQFRDSGWL